MKQIKTRIEALEAATPADDAPQHYAASYKGCYWIDGCSVLPDEYERRTALPGTYKVYVELDVEAA